MAALRIPLKLGRILWCIAVPIVSLLAYLAIGIGMATLVDEPILGTIMAGGLVATAMLLVRWLRPAWFRYDPQPPARDGRASIVNLAIGGVALAFLAGQALSLWLYSIGGSAAFDQSLKTRQEAGVLLTLTLVLVAAPVAEELILRGLIYPLLRRKVGIIASIAISTVAFAALHANVVQFAVALPLAVVLSLVYERTRRIWPCMLVHLGFNLATVVTPAAAIAPLSNPISAFLLTTAFAWIAMLLYRRIVEPSAPQV